MFLFPLAVMHLDGFPGEMKRRPRILVDYTLINLVQKTLRVHFSGFPRNVSGSQRAKGPFPHGGHYRTGQVITPTISALQRRPAFKQHSIYDRWHNQVKSNHNGKNLPVNNISYFHLANRLFFVCAKDLTGF